MTDVALAPRDRGDDPGTGATSLGTRTRTVDVAVVGLGYVGLPTVLALHAAGRTVVGIDVSTERLEAVRRVDCDLIEEDRQRLAVAVADTERFHVTADPARLGEAAAVVIAVPTPIDAHAVPDLRALRAACDTVVRHARVDQTIVLTSTTYVGSTEELLVEPLRRRGLFVGTDVHVAFSPERIDPGNTVNTQDVTPRVVGGVTPACTARAARVLGHVAPEVVAVSSAEAAEMTKLLENTFRAVNIAFANEIADVCGHHGIDVTEVIGAAATKPYGFMPFMPGPGVGGHCIPCDPHYLLWGLRPQRHRAPVTEQAMATLEARPLRVVERARAVLGQRGMALAGARVLVAGVAYKPDVADVRESPAAVVLDGLLDAGARTSYVDPLVERLDLPSGRHLRSLPSVDAEPVDLVVVHTLHAALPAYELLTHAPLVLDCTYRLPVGDHVFRP